MCFYEINKTCTVSFSDLQSASKPKVPTPAKSPAGGVSLQGATTTSTSSDLFGADDKDEDLFGEKPRTESQPKVGVTRET